MATIGTSSSGVRSCIWRDGRRCPRSSTSRCIVPGLAPAPLTTAHGKVDPPPEVFRHFRDLDDIQRLAAVTNLEIDVVKEPFIDRLAYFGRVCERVRAPRSGAVLVLLDPDIGLAAETPGPEHVTSVEVAAVFEALRPGDVLVCYQHARRQKDWRGRARRAFANAPGLPSFEVEVLGSELAQDVLLLAVRKGAPRGDDRDGA